MKEFERLAPQDPEHSQRRDLQSLRKQDVQRVTLSLGLPFDCEPEYVTGNNSPCTYCNGLDIEFEQPAFNRVLAFNSEDSGKGMCRVNAVVVDDSVVNSLGHLRKLS